MFDKLLTVLLLLIVPFSEAAVRRCSTKKVFIKILQNSQKKTCAGVFVLIKLQASKSEFINKETPAQAFLYKFCKIFNNPYFIEQLRATKKRST